MGGEPLPAAAPAAATTSKLPGIDDVIAALAARPAPWMLLVAIVVAAAAHGIAAAMGSGLRVHKAAASAQAVAMVEAADPLPEDMPPPPPPPPPRPAPPSATASSTSTSTQPPAMTHEAAPTPGLPSLLPGNGQGVRAASGGAGPAAAVSSTTPQATVAPQVRVVPAKARSQPPPRYPAQARQSGMVGVVIVQLHISASGDVVEARVVESTPTGVFDAAALESVRAWRFQPATEAGTAVASWVRQSIRFTLEGA